MRIQHREGGKKGKLTWYFSVFLKGCWKALSQIYTIQQLISVGVLGRDFELPCRKNRPPVSPAGHIRRQKQAKM